MTGMLGTFWSSTVLLVITLQTQGTHTVKTLVGFEGTLGYPRIVTITLNSFKINIKINK